MIKDFSIKHDLCINASKSEVFDALTKPDLLINWWPLKCNDAAKLGESYNFYFTDQYDWYGKVIECLIGESFVIEMTQSDEDWINTSFGFKLEESDKAT